MARVAALVLALAWLLASVPAGAEHEVYYRYVVLGFVKDARGKPVAGRQVELVRDKTGFSYLGETDVKGFYMLVSRLGDESAGEPLTLRLGGASLKLTARFDPTNHTDDRGTRVDGQGTKLVERAAWFPSTLANALGALGR
ncbi:MAG: hypothetical protein ACREIY_01360 [Candidatus Rokuibacteriota bacterium]